MLEALVGVLGVAVMAIIGWAFSLSNRVSVLETNAVNLTALISANAANLLSLVDAKLTEVNRRLARIENKLDAADEE